MRTHLFALCLIAVALAACKLADDRTAAVPAPSRNAPGAVPTQTGDADAPAAEPEFPTLQVVTLDGIRYDLAAQRGKWVVVNFWATWCSPCLKEMPELSALDAMHEHIEVIGLAYEEIDTADLAAFLQQRPVVYPIAIVDIYDPPADFATPRGLPMTYLIAPNGKIAEQFLGPVTAKEIEAVIAQTGGPNT